jgi:CheY-like chemotaxis protein
MLKHLETKFEQRVRRILVVEDDGVHRESTCQLLGGDDVEIVAVGTAAEALSNLGESTFDCMVLDLSLPDRTGLDVLEEITLSVVRTVPSAHSCSPAARRASIDPIDSGFGATRSGSDG